MAKGIVAAGHELTVQAAEWVLADGGNAFDAAIAAFYAACLAEPVLASPGGGGFLLAKQVDKTPVLYDFFVQTPGQNKNDSLDFFPIVADFGEITQEFHIGQASIAVPGAIRGIFDVYRDLASMPMRELVKPCMEFASQGIETNAFQALIFDIIAPIFLHSPKVQQHYSSQGVTDKLLNSGDIFYPYQLANTLEAIAIESDRLFYEGEIAQDIIHACDTGGGLLSAEDLKTYACIKRKPLAFNYKNCHITTNPAPSSGGTLIAFALQLLEKISSSSGVIEPFGCYQSLHELVLSMEYTQKARLEHALANDNLQSLLDAQLLNKYTAEISSRAQSFRGTTHISIIDQQGNMAGLTLSNGEGCGYMLTDTGIMLNNMLGEQDLNPQGFFNWQTKQRMTSMMAPSLMIFADGRHVVTGSGGSNRIRTALMQVMLNLIDHAMPVKQAVLSPRLHFEQDFLNIEGQFDADIIARLQQDYAKNHVWSDANLFFGGAHSVLQDGRHFSGAGDFRRGGVFKVVA